MHAWPTFWVYFQASLQFLYLPPFCIPSVVFAASAAVPVVRRRLPFSELWVRTYPTLLAQSLLYIATLALGAVYAFDWNYPASGSNAWALRAVALTLFLSVGLSVYWIATMKGQRWFAISLAALQLWLLLGANHIAWVAILGKA